MPLALLDVSVTLPPVQNVVGPPGVIVGVAVDVTLTVNVAVAVALALFVTVSVNVEFVAVQLAATSAVTLPATSMLMLLMVTPVPVNGAALTDSVLAAWPGSLTVAICALIAVAPCCLESGAAAVITGVSLSKQTVTSFKVGDMVLSVVLNKALYFR